MKLNKKLAISTVALTAAFGLTACNDTPQSNANAAEASQAAAGQTSLVRSQPVHDYSYSQLRANVQELEDAEANGTITTSFFMQMGLPDPVFTCPSIGAPIPSTAQLTNPSQAVDGSGNSGYAMATIGQMENTGVYTGDSTGTYIMCVGANGAVNPVYWEGNVLTAFGTATWDKAAHQMQITGDSGSKFSGIKK